MANTSEMANRKSRIANRVVANGGPSVLSLCVTRHSLLAIRQLTPFARETQFCFLNRPLPAWWLLQGDQTRSHPELGRQTPSRQWYFVSRHGRVGRRQACKERFKTKATRLSASSSCFANGEVANGEWIMAKPRRSTRRPKAAHSPLANPHSPNHSDAGWSSPVARQAHNLKAAGSNPAPATKSKISPPHQNAGGFFASAPQHPSDRSPTRITPRWDTASPCAISDRIKNRFLLGGRHGAAGHRYFLDGDAAGAG